MKQTRKKRITDKERKVFEFIKNYVDENNFAPTVREIQEEFGLKSTSTAHRYIITLSQKGLLERENNCNRAIRIAGYQKATSIPVVGTVTAGKPITAIEYVDSYLTMSLDKKFSGKLFALKVRGESMINIGIFDGDTVIVEQTEVASNGDIVVALVNDEEATVKTFYKEKGHYRLQPENDTMEPIIVDEVKILGKVVAMMRYF
ncbi:MAG: transcriptional repressor LexA [Ruminococcus sp.]|nr:transcriptional repressor LexA [Ruminococcus sp.]